MRKKPTFEYCKWPKEKKTLRKEGELETSSNMQWYFGLVRSAAIPSLPVYRKFAIGRTLMFFLKDIGDNNLADFFVLWFSSILQLYGVFVNGLTRFRQNKKGLYFVTVGNEARKNP